jgi:hypothetical protein
MECNDGEDDEDNDDVERDEDDEHRKKIRSASFGAKDQAAHFKKILRGYGVQFAKWCVCLIGDNAAVNLKTAELCEKPHIGCKNHKLNLDVMSMLKNDLQLNDILERLQGLMLSLKTMKNSAVLEAYTHLCPSLCVKTRWSGKYRICKKFLMIRDNLVEMHRNDQNPFSITDDLILRQSFKQKVEKYVKMLGYIQASNEALQEKGIKLADAQMHLDHLTKWVVDGNDAASPDDHWARDCCLGRTYIGTQSKKSKSRLSQWHY